MCPASGAASVCRGPVWEFEDRIHITGACSKRYPCAWFFQSRLTDVAPYLSFAPPTPSTAPRSPPLLTGDGRSSITLTLGNQCPRDASDLVGQRHDHQHWLACAQAFRSAMYPGERPSA